ncbi:hypothetical protein [uncultured Tenacibaculum sp.]|uniref:hypothetical protein n=1 Tax=uncultured Tenacibaculum sp. TaxID=174713 RepID=UPI00261222AE|nr:hypothetical protein [uncultured Tenacibaculum sp.]
MKVFKEEQRFTQTWLHILLVLGSIIPIYSIVTGWMSAIDKSLTANSSSLISLTAILLVHVLIYSCVLKTKIDEHGIHYQLFPFHSKLKTKKWKEIKNIYVRQYNPIAEYGGWGIRCTLSKKGIAVNIKGNIGIQLELVNGEKLLIGTQKKDDVELVLHTYENKIKIL